MGQIDSNSTPPHVGIRLASLRPQTVLTVLVIEGVLAGVFLVSSASMERNALLLGLSAQRLALAAAWSVAIACLALLTVMVRRRALPQLLQRRFSGENHEGALLAALLVAATLCWTMLLVAAISLGPLAEYGGVVRLGFDRGWPIVLWGFLAGAELTGFIAAKHWPVVSRDSPERRTALIGGGFVFGAVPLCLVYYVFFHTHLYWSAPAFRPSLLPVMLAAMAFTSTAIYCWQRAHTSRTYLRLAEWSTTLAIFLTAVSIYMATAMTLRTYYTPDKAYFHLLAQAMLEGHFYITDPPSTHDLVWFGGNWYMAHPPLVALLMIPWLIASGGQKLNTVLFSGVFAAASVSLVYLLLNEMNKRKWLDVRQTDILWLCALFGFGSGLWWVSTSGEFWFLSQICALTFLALAAIIAAKNWPAWLVGGCLGLAMLARPTVFTYWPFLLGIAAESIFKRYGRASGVPLIRWSFLSWVGVGMGVVALMGYNWARFGDITDAGSYRQNIASWLAADVVRYGIFSPHYFARNLGVVLVGLPELSPECRGLIKPSEQGMSILLTTPTLLYLARAWRRSPWVIGAWFAVAASLLLLLLYYNTGAWQFGYRYILDLIVPVMALLGLAMGKAKSLPFRMTIVLSIAVNAVGVAWWGGIWC